MLLPSPFIIIGASPIPLIEMLTTAGDTRAASGAKDSGAAPAAQIGAKAARPEKIARGRARQKPMGLSSKRKRRDALRPAEDLDFRTYAERRNLLRRILRAYRQRSCPSLRACRRRSCRCPAGPCARFRPRSERKRVRRREVRRREAQI